jgi:integrating conjugative element protein (TIGR03749 family)
MPAGLADTVRTQVVAGTVYWVAKSEFTPQRIQVRDTATGQIYLVDLSARSSASTAPVIVTQGAAPAQMDGSAGGMASAPAAVAAGTVTAPKMPTYDYGALTRFAAQSLYAPRRLAPTLPGVFQAPVDGRPIDLVRGESIQATPLIAWRSGNLHITAVRLRNMGMSPVILDPRSLRGLWVAATFQHARLFPKGDEADTTAVYLISAKPFEHALRGVY